MRSKAHSSITKGQMHIATGSTFTTSATPDTWTKIAGSWSDGHLQNFVVDDVNDRLTYTGIADECALFNGIASITTDKGCVIYFALYQKGANVHDTTVEVAPSAKSSALAASAVIHLTAGDYFEGWAKSDTASVTMTIRTLNILIFGEY